MLRTRCAEYAGQLPMQRLERCGQRESDSRVLQHVLEAVHLVQVEMVEAHVLGASSQRSAG